MNDLCEWEIPYRVWHALYNEQIYTADDLVQLGERRLLRVPGIGRGAVAAILKAAAGRGISIPFSADGKTLAQRVNLLEMRVAKLESR
jgi:DNA-directed RNA polymerase alpha subunit